MSERTTHPPKRIILAVMILSLAVVALTTAWLGMNVLLLTFASICFAILLDSLATFISRYVRLSRGKALAIVVTGIIALSVGTVWLMAPSIARQTDDLAKTLPEQTKKLEAKMMEYRWGRMILGEGFTSNNSNSNQSVSIDVNDGSADHAGEKQSSSDRKRSEPSNQPAKRVEVSVKADGDNDGRNGSATSPTTAPTSQPGEKLTKSVQAAAEPMVRKAGHWATGLINVAVMIVVVFVAGTYMAIDPPLYIEGTLHLVTRNRRPRVRQMFGAMGYALRWWLIGQGITMLVIGTLTGLGLWLIGVRLWLTFAVLAAMFNFVPNFGPLVSFIPAIVFSLAEPNGMSKAGWVAALYVVAQTFEGYFLTPMVQKKAVDTPPALLILFQVLAGYMLGGLGLMMAAPLLAAIVVAVKMLYVEDVIGDEMDVHGAEAS